MLPGILLPGVVFITCYMKTGPGNIIPGNMLPVLMWYYYGNNIAYTLPGLVPPVGCTMFHHIYDSVPPIVAIYMLHTQ